MKTSHREILQLLNGGGYLRRNPYSRKTQWIMRDLRCIRAVRHSTIEEMATLGLLTLQDVGNTRQFRPVKQEPIP